MLLELCTSQQRCVLVRGGVRFDNSGEAQLELLSMRYNWREKVIILDYVDDEGIDLT